MLKDYSQPDFYRFNSDSIDLINWLVSHYKSASTILDLGAGCGIIGIEVARLLHPLELILVEAQSEFNIHLEENIRTFLPHDISCAIWNHTFSQIPESKKFRFILANPPYFLPGEGELPDDRNRQIARTFILDNWEILLNKVSRLLDLNGKCFIVIHKNNRLQSKIDVMARNFKLRIETHELSKVFILEVSALNID